MQVRAIVEHLTITEGIKRLRDRLHTPRECLRLVGLSGLGKTRLVQALFEESSGQNPLDSNLAIYTDYSEETAPTAREMARQLIANQQRAILVVDNCNPQTHSELARLCTSEGSKISLITVEYDVGDEEPEHTQVFHLQSASPELVTEWIKQSFPDISQVDRGKLAEFSDGNFRVARRPCGDTRKRRNARQSEEPRSIRTNIPAAQSARSPTTSDCGGSGASLLNRWRRCVR